MIAALTPIASWAVFLICVGVGVTVYVVVAGGRRYRRMEREVLHSRFFSDEATPTIRILGGVYDWNERGDFDR